MSKIKQGLTAIASEVLEEVRIEAEAIILDAEKEAKETLKAAKEEADKTYEDIVNEANAKSAGERRKIESLTQVETRNRLLQEKEALVDEAFDKTLAKLKDFVKTEEYQSILEALILEAAKKMGSKSLVVYVNSKDKAWLEQGNLSNLSKKLRVGLKLADKAEECIGGCKVQTVDGKILYDNTLENRLQQFKPTLRLEVAKILFAKEA